MFGDYRWTEVESIRSTAETAKSKARSTEIDIAQLAARLESLSLSCQAMWELLRDRTDLTDDDIMDRMHEIDLRDGRADGRLKASTLDCPQCGRPCNSRRKNCIYCGEAITSDHVFDK